MVDVNLIPLPGLPFIPKARIQNTKQRLAILYG
jgi:hypothetical protein